MRVCGAAAVGWNAGSDTIHIAAKKQSIECATFPAATLAAAHNWAKWF